MGPPEQARQNQGTDRLRCAPLGAAAAARALPHRDRDHRRPAPQGRPAVRAERAEERAAFELLRTQRDELERELAAAREALKIIDVARRDSLTERPDAYELWKLQLTRDESAGVRVTLAKEVKP